MTPKQVIGAARAAIADRDEIGLHILGAFLTWADVRADPRAKTACIGHAPGGGWRIRLSPAFCEEHVRDGSDALHLLLHEALHAVKGHFGLDACSAPARRAMQNLALDILVNSFIRRRWKLGDALLQRLYSADSFPGCLLMPPDLVLDADEESMDAAAEHMRRLGCVGPRAVARLWLDGWSADQEPAAFWRRFEWVMRCELPDAWCEPLLLLGDHSHRRRGGVPKLAPLLAGLAVPCSSEARPRPPDRSALRRVVEAVTRALEGDRRGRARLPATPADTSPIPWAGRRELAAMALGYMPPFYRRSSELMAEPASVQLYLDVSGSMDETLPVVRGLAVALGPRLAEPCWAMSGEVRPLPHRDLLARRIETDWRTSFDAMLEHAVMRRFRKVVLFTDGMDEIGTAAREKARRAGLWVVVVLEAGTDCKWERQWEGLGEVVRVGKP